MSPPAYLHKGVTGTADFPYGPAQASPTTRAWTGVGGVPATGLLPLTTQVGREWATCVCLPATYQLQVGAGVANTLEEVTSLLE